MNEFDILLNEQLQNEEFRKEYDAMKAKFSSIQDMIDERKQELHMLALKTIKNEHGAG
ncbi:MAG: hypothetical protein K2J39_06455 [Ruminococcus sp.]|nr:hypothetical protein [Ruminococcus sp.]